MRPSVWSMVLGVWSAGCVGKALEEESADLAISLRNVTVMGPIAYGDDLTSTTRQGRRYRAWTFEGRAGDAVDVRVSSAHGDPVAYLCDRDLGILVRNDDAEDDGARYPTDSHLTLALEAGGTYQIVVKDYYGARRRFTVQLRGTPASAPDPAWDAAAIAEADRLVLDGPLPTPVPSGSMPEAARARYDASAAVLEVPQTYTFDVAGEALFMVVATDGSGEGNVVAVDLVDAAGRWFAHALGHQVWDGGGLSWSLDDEDPTLCSCAEPLDGMAACAWLDGARTRSTTIACD